MAFWRKFLTAFGIAAASSTSGAASSIVKDVGISADWIAKALTSSGYKADFSLNSLKEVDRFFDEQAPSGTPNPEGLLGRDVGSRLFALGSYVGEVIRRNNGGEWQGQDNDPQAEINVVLKLKNGNLLLPVQRTIKRFKYGAENNIYAYAIAAGEP